MEDDAPNTEELRAVQREREVAETHAAGEAPSEEAEREHRRRAEKAAYLEQRLAEQERSLAGEEG